MCVHSHNVFFKFNAKKLESKCATAVTAPWRILNAAKIRRSFGVYTPPPRHSALHGLKIFEYFSVPK